MGCLMGEFTDFMFVLFKFLLPVCFVVCGLRGVGGFHFHILICWKSVLLVCWLCGSLFFLFVVGFVCCLVVLC